MSESERRSRTLHSDGLVNARDLGGLRRNDGTLTPSGVFFRSESVDAVTEQGWQEIFDAGIRTVVDLRQPGERAADTGERPAWLTTVNVDLDNLSNTAFWAGYWENGLVGTALYFLPHLEAMPQRAGAALSAIVSAPAGGVLFHCAAGRDRTGILSLLLLAAVETDPDEIVDDYLETVRRGDLRAEASGRENVEEKLDEFCRSHGTSTEGAMRDAVAGLDLTAFLHASGLTAVERSALASWRGAL